MDIMDDGARSRMEQVAARLRAFHDERVARYRAHLEDEPDGPLPQPLPTLERRTPSGKRTPSPDGA